MVGPPAGPEPPFPLRLTGPVIAGFGRGSKELGIPTANIPVSGLSVGGCEDVESGVYYGWAGLGRTPPPPPPPPEEREGEIPPPAEPDKPAAAAAAPEEEEEDSDPRPAVYPMVMSIGWNPYYKNSVRSIEVHLLHSFPATFYGATLRLTILGFIRPEYDYVSKDSLIEDIRTDIDVARRCLEREPYGVFGKEPWLVEGL
ncbi:MAG: riboflavin kinase [Trichoglossum hirsutum]|nr:MAG: riboflavin kinase [Trichoglossum hirsutum]